MENITENKRNLLINVITGELELIEPNRVLTDLEIIEQNILHGKNKTVESILKIGENLIKAKDLVPHGKWKNWLEIKVDFSVRSAQKFMKCATEFSNATLSSDLGQTKIFALLDIKQEKRDEFIADNDVSEITTTVLKKKIKEFNTPKVEPKVEEKSEPIEADFKPVVATAEVEIGDYESVKTNIHKIESNIEANVDTMSVEQLVEMENELESHEKTMKELKNKITITKFLAHEKLSKDFKITIEESFEGYGSEIDFRVYYSLFLERDNEKIVLLDKVQYFFFENFDMDDTLDYVTHSLNKLLQNAYISKEVYESLVLRCVYLRGSVVQRYQELLYISYEEYKKNHKLELEETNLTDKQATLKKFYNTLVMKFHPDHGGTSEDFALVTKLKEEWGI